MPDLSAGAAGLSGLATYVLAAAGVLVLLGIVLWLARRSNGGEVARKAPPARRLAVVDQIALDEKRRLVLIQRDGVEHLVILGGSNELLVETGIGDPRTARYNERELRAPAPVREVPELPAFPAAPAREAIARDAGTRDLPPLAAPVVERAVRQAAPPEPVPPAFAEPALSRRAVMAEAPPPIRPAPPRSESARPQPAPPPAPVVRRAEPAPPVMQQAAPAIQPAPVIPPMPEPVLRAEPEPVRPPEAPFAAPAREPAVLDAAAPAPEPETAAQAAELARAGGLLARLRRPRQSETAPQGPAPAESALARLRDSQPAAVEAHLASLDQSDMLPEMPSHSVPEVVLDLPTAPEPEPQVTAAAMPARAEPDMSKLLDMIIPAVEASTANVPTAPATPTAPAAPAAPASPAGSAAPGESTEPPRVAVKIDPFFANMAQRLEETLRRPIAPGTPTAPSAPSSARPATNAAEIERVIDLALSTPVEPGTGTPGAPTPRAPEVAPPTRDELEAEMANLLGRGR
ncbi:hypothetical protein G3545_00650 [Starkeya sp. ORNL1]|uniref:flagellar biosynthetic protein FliO n=1 Tax=Starkeya sp. ORNL1 TaxID=2709380 RepID=UPI0014635401|nr:flagellar biosynthetic protein FliO [Starkeya sp. ORNL1]QJP12298.1 hypothetical protein G3545_00650 [Starkeya sp. ORNL1]